MLELLSFYSIISIRFHCRYWRTGSNKDGKMDSEVLNELCCFRKRNQPSKIFNTSTTFYYHSKAKVKSYNVLFSFALVGIPRVHWYGEDAGCCIMVMELLNENIEEVFTR